MRGGAISTTAQASFGALQPHQLVAKALRRRKTENARPAGTGNWLRQAAPGPPLRPAQWPGSPRALASSPAWESNGGELGSIGETRLHRRFAYPGMAPQCTGYAASRVLLLPRDDVLRARLTRRHVGGAQADVRRADDLEPADRELELRETDRVPA